MIALIAVSSAVYAIDKPYSYKIPNDMHVLPGMRVIIPFGRGNRRCEGVVLDITDGNEEKLKAIEAVLDQEPVLSEGFIRMAAFIRERYFCTIYDAIRAMLPAGLWFHTQERFVLNDTEMDLSALENVHCAAWMVAKTLLDHEEGADITSLISQLEDANLVEDGLSWLKKKNLITSNVDFSRKIHDKTEKIASLAISAEETMEYALRKIRSAPMQYEVLKLLCAIGSGSTKEICYLTGATMATIRRLENLGYLELSVRDVFRNPLPEHVKPADAMSLNDVQLEVFHGLLQQAEREEPGVALLHGVTGSGKTAIYISMIRHVLEQGRSAMLLVPEIALTPQLLQLLVSHFGKDVAVLHSALRVSERYDEWKRIRSGMAKVVVGTRSAVFAPIENLGLLIVDEEQEHTYKSENSPRYHAREVAIYRGHHEKALVLLGSATPSLETMYRARSGVYTLFRLPERYNGKDLPDVKLLDMRQELKSGNGSSISRYLRERLEKNIDSGRQSILFLNRRGASRCMICVECGNVVMCPKCSVSLTYHAANGRLMCHHCGYSQPAVDHCDQCGGHLKTLGIGTQKIQQELEEMFPGIQVLRMDADTVSASNSHEVLLSRFEKENIPILIGTQMVTKGLNFENVTLVGVIDADSSLYADHYRASETAFSMLTQVIGRSGRGEREGQAVIQTMTPEHTVLQLAAAQDYDRFYDLEITLRKLQNAPPFSDVFSVMFIGAMDIQVLKSAASFRQMLQSALQSSTFAAVQAQIYGPSPASVFKVNNTYRYRLTLHCANQRPVRQLLAHLLQVFSKDKSNRGVSAFVDINAYE